MTGQVIRKKEKGKKEKKNKRNWVPCCWVLFPRFCFKCDTSIDTKVPHGHRNIYKTLFANPGASRSHLTELFPPSPLYGLGWNFPNLLPQGIIIHRYSISFLKHKAQKASHRIGILVRIKDMQIQQYPFEPPSHSVCPLICFPQARELPQLKPSKTHQDPVQPPSSLPIFKLIPTF